MRWWHLFGHCTVSQCSMLEARDAFEWDTAMPSNGTVKVFTQKWTFNPIMLKMISSYLLQDTLMPCHWITYVCSFLRFSKLFNRTHTFSPVQPDSFNISWKSVTDYFKYLHLIGKHFWFEHIPFIFSMEQV